MSKPRTHEEIAEEWWNRFRHRSDSGSMDALVAALREAADAARQEVIAKANEAWPDGHDEPALNAADLKCRIKDLLLERRRAEAALAKWAEHECESHTGCAEALVAARQEERETLSVLGHAVADGIARSALGMHTSGCQCSLHELLRAVGVPADARSHADRWIDAVRQEEWEALRKWAENKSAKSELVYLYDIRAWLDARSRAEEPKP